MDLRKGREVSAMHPILVGMVIVIAGMCCASVGRGQSSRIPVALSRVPTRTTAQSASARTSKLMAGSAGYVEGYIFWDQSRVAYNPSVACQGLQVELDVITPTGLQKFGTSTQFQFAQSQRPGHGLGLCGYNFSRVPEGEALQLQVNISNPFGIRLTATGPFGAVGGLINVPGGPCNNPSRSATSSTNLESGWVGCGEHAYNVNFELVPRNAMATLPRGGTMLLQQARGTNAPTSKPMLLQPSPQPGGPVQSNGTLVPAVRPAIGAQPSSSTAGGFTGGVRPNGAATPGAQPLVGSGSSLNGGNAGSPSALIGLLRKQGSLKVVSGQRKHYPLSASSIRTSQVRRRNGVGLISPGQTMAASSPQSRVATSPAIARGLRIAYVPSDLLSPKENTWCAQQEAQGGAPAVLRIDGKTTGPNYSPDPKTNPHTIVGCGFGNGGSVQLRLLQQEFEKNWWGNDTAIYTDTIYTVKLVTQSWNDHEIVAAVDPNTSGVPDWFDVTLEVKTKVSGYGPGGQFTALKQSVLLTSIPQKESSLDQSGSPYFLSPVSNYYGLDGTVAVMRQGLSGPVAGQDQFSLQLAPGFVVDSTQTDLLVSDTNANVTSKPASVNGNTITVTYPVVPVQSGNSTVYYSIYGLKVWVTGPVGMSPIAP